RDFHHFQRGRPDGLRVGRRGADDRTPACGLRGAAEADGACLNPPRPPRYTVRPMAKTSTRKQNKPLTYADTGVDIEAGDAVVGLIKHHMRRTYGPRVLGRHGAFAGCFRLDYNEKLFKRNYKDPVLVACT